MFLESAKWISNFVENIYSSILKITEYFKI